nr:MAG TPA: tail assembly chaperone protein [Caudoviricetes sp.]
MKEIVIQGVACPIHFGLRALCDFTKAQNADFEATVSSAEALGSLDSIVALTVTGLNDGARRANIERRYSDSEVWDIFDEEPELILTVSEIFMESITPLTDKLGDMAGGPNGHGPKKGRCKK